MSASRSHRWPWPHRLGASLLAALAAGAAAAEPVVATPFAVRREVQEWCEEAECGGGDQGALLARAQALLAAHGSLLFAGPEGARPIAEVIAARLRARNLAAAFADAYAAQAERRLAEAHDEAALRAVAQGHPGTPAARLAWRRLADRAWDGGRLGAFLRDEEQAGPGDPARQARLAAARALLAGDPGEAPPERLTGLDELWRNQRDGAAPAAAVRPRRRVAGADGEAGEVPLLAFSAPLGELSAVSDGLRLRLIDHLAGREVAAPLPFGNSPAAGRPPAPIVLRDGFVAAGVLDQQRLVLVRCDRQGAARWRALGPPMGFNPAISAPRLLDGQVCIASVDENEGGADLMVRAWSADDGRPLWEALVARLGAGRGWIGDNHGGAAPDLAVAGGELVVLANRGLLARLASTGQVLGLWTYPSRFDDAATVFRREGVRRGGDLLGAGDLAVATPGDAEGVVLVLAPDGTLRTYRGDGAAGSVVAAEAGTALLAGPATVVALDLATLRPRWAAPAPAGGGPVGAYVGGGRALLGSPAELRLYASADGRQLDRRSLDARLGFGLAAGMVLAGSEGAIAAWGTAQALGDRLAAAVAAAPGDWRPRAALASVAANRGDDERAVALYEEALARGAPADYAEQAARLLRTRLDLARPAAMAPAIERLAGLGAGAGELAWWRGRLAQGEGRAADAAAAFRAVLAGPDRLLAVRGRVSVSLHALAGLALAAAGDPAPAWSRVEAAAPEPAPAQAWTVGERRGRGLMVAGGLALGYADGVVSARRLADGGEAWWRRPARPLLGVQQREAAPGDGLPLSVFAGTAAAAAGLRTGDLLLRFNGAETRDFAADLVPAVLKAGVRGDFTAVVRRRERELELHGRLGGELAEPVDADTATALVWPTLVQGGRPEGLWFAAHDLASGAELWRHSLPPATREAGPPAPLLAADGLVLAPDGADLVALAVRPGAGGAPAGRTAWRLAGQGALLARARLVTPRLLWLPDPEAGISRLVDAVGGRLLAELPVDGARTPLLDGGELFAQRAERSLGCYDLARAAMRWSAPGCSPALAVEGDAVYCLDAADRLRILDRASGAVRRELGEPGQVLAAHRAGDLLYLHHAPEAGAHALTALAAAGGAQRWTVRLPPGVEVVATAADGDACALVAADRDAAGDGETVYLRLSPDGQPERWTRLDQDPVVARPVFLAGGILQAWPEGIAAQPGRAFAPPPRLACPDLPGERGPAAALAALPGSAWRPCGAVRWTLARRAGRLLIAAQGGDLQVRLGDPGQAVDLAGGELRLRQAGEPVLRWRQAPVAGAWRLAASGQGDDGLRWAELEPPAGRQGGQPLALRATAGEAVDGAAGPWWLMAGWIPVLGAP